MNFLRESWPNLIEKDEEQRKWKEGAFFAARLEDEQHNDNVISREEQQNLLAFKFSLVTHMNQKKPNKLPWKGTFSLGLRLVIPNRLYDKSFLEHQGNS